MKRVSSEVFVINIVTAWWIKTFGHLYLYFLRPKLEGMRTMMVIIPFTTKEEERKTMMWVFFFLQYCAFHLFGNPLLLKHDPPVNFKQSKKLLSLSSNVPVCFFLLNIESKAFLLFFCIIQDSARDYDSQDRRKLLTVSSY